jgi:hypothetical protein
MKNPVVEQTWLDEDTALKAAARKGWGFESLLLRHLFICAPVGSFVASSARKDALFGIAPRNASLRYTAFPVRHIYMCSDRLLRRLLRTLRRSVFFS